MAINSLLMVGGGQMGSGICHVMAKVGIKCTMYDINQTEVDKGLASINKNMDSEVKKGKMTQEDKDKAVAQITGKVLPLKKEDCDVDLVIEAVPEKLALKMDYFKQLDELCPERTILATNTSTLPVTKIASVTNRPSKVVGMHFFSPVFIMKLIEVVKPLGFDQAVVDEIVELGKRIGKNPIPVNDYPGFVGNRIMVPMMNEAIQCIFEGVADAKTIDDVIVNGFNHPIGPIALVDAIGLDTILACMEVYQAELGDDKYRPCPLLKKYNEAGWIGKKAACKKGFYDYNK